MLVFLILASLCLNAMPLPSQTKLAINITILVMGVISALFGVEIKPITLPL